MVKEIQLTQDKVALVDDEDYDWLNQYKWRVQNAKRTYYARKGNNKIIFMHRFIINAPEGIQVDHEDHNGWNNQKHNLRLGTVKNNGYNRQKPLTYGKNQTSSKYKGVTLKKPNKKWNVSKWQVSIIVDNKQIRLGFFDDEIEAALAYDTAAKIHFGEFAKTNF